MNETLYEQQTITWNWSEFCPTGLRPWQNQTNDLLPCFQEIVLQFPIYACFAIVSSFYCGTYARTVARNSAQLKLIYSRITVSIILAIIPIAESLYFVLNGIHLNPIEILLTCTKVIMWIVHTGYLLVLRNHGGISHRGPLVMNVFWTAVFVLDAIWLRTSFSYEFWGWSLAVFILDVCYLGTFPINGSAVQVRSVLMRNEEQESLLSNRYVHFDTNLNEASLGHAQDEANIASKFLFYWVEALITKGVTGNLKKIEDLFDLPDSLNIHRNYERLQIAICRSNSLFWALHKAFGREFYIIGLLRFIADTAGFAGPLLLGGLLSENSNKDSSDVLIDKAYLYAFGLLLFTIIGAICSVHFNWRISILGMKMRTGVVTTIYSTALEARGLEKATPEVLNLMSTDTDRIVNSCISFHSFWSIPFQLFTTLYLLYTQVGSAFIAGVLFAAALIPVNRLLAVKIQNYSIGLMNAKDNRLSTTNETIQGAKHIKLHAWEDIFIKKIKDCREEEMKFLTKRKYLDAICVYFWATTPVLMCLLTFGVSVLIGNPLTATTTYTSVALLNMLISPLNAFPWVLNGLIEAWVSIKRVQELLILEELDYSTYYDPIFQNKLKSDEKPLVLEIKNGTFEYDLLENQANDYCFKLAKINLQIKQGELVCIEGPVGSGKSTLISAIIAKMKCTQGVVEVQDLNAGFGYVSQQPWLQRGTIKENIIWGSVYDEQKYKKVIFSCALTEDILVLGGDHIGVGENGHTLSGGQRMRISLARAVYQDKNIYLLDDVLSSVDVHVANHIIKYCILGFLKHKTRIVITENSTLFLHANQILKMENGELRKSDLMSDSFEMSEEEDLTSTLEEWGYNSRLSSIDLEQNTESDKKSIDSIMLEESKEQGYIKYNVLKVYWNSMKGSLAFSVVLFVILMQLSRNLSDIWLAKWVSDFDNVPNNVSLLNRVKTVDVELNADTNNTNHTLGFYLGIYTSLAVTNSIITLVRAFIFAYAGLKAAKFIHNTLLHRVLYTKFRFFDITSVGRILNRFSSDTYTIDDSLPFILNIFLANIAGLIGAILITLYAMPWLGLVIIPMVPIYYSLQYRYRHASRDIKRLSSNALSPLYTHFTETLQGLTTIRAMRASSRFQRDFHVKLEESIKAQLSSSAAQQWLALRLQLLGSFLVGGAGLLAALTSAHYAYPSLVGLAISYALSITSLLGGVLNSFAETEQEFVAVERVSQYLELEPEENANGSIDPPFGWPNQGALQFKNVYFKYREHLTPALINFTLRTESFERIAIVGRTGAGKSSVLSALLRVAPIANGEIVLDCVNLKTLALHILRDRIAIIPQEPFLFEGTVRDNLDPRGKFLDSELWNAITACLATPLVQSLGGLNGYLERSGNNLSAGQKQLLCLTRALLKNSQIVCIDEGTSNLDTDSEAAIQIALKYSFRSSTVFLIAHRLKGLQNVDRIIVMDSGQIAEEGKPKELASNPNSMFAKMLQEQKNTDYVLCDSS